MRLDAGTSGLYNAGGGEDRPQRSCVTRVVRGGMAERYFVNFDAINKS